MSIERLKLIEDIKRIVEKKREEHIKYYSFLPVKYLFISISLITFYLIVKQLTVDYFINIFSNNFLMVINVVATTGLIVSFATVLHMLSFTHYKYKTKIFKIKIFNIEAYLSELSDDDLILLQNELERIKVLCYRGELICLQDTLVLSDMYTSYCIPLHALKSIKIRCRQGGLSSVTCIYKQTGVNGKNKLEVHIGRFLYDRFIVPYGINIEKMKSDNKLFCSLIEETWGW